MRFAMTFSALLLATAPALAQHNHGMPAAAPMHQHDAAPMAGANMSGAATPASKAFVEANDKMHRDMDAPVTGDADVDFVRGMIPHHQGAVDMAKIVLQYGNDPEIRKIAEEIVAAQEKEIAQFKDWLARRQK